MSNGLGAYIKIMDFLKVYYRHLSESKAAPQEVLDTCFKHLKPLLGLHQEMLKEFHLRRSSWETEPRLGSLMRTQVKYLGKTAIVVFNERILHQTVLWFHLQQCTSLFLPVSETIKVLSLICYKMGTFVPNVFKYRQMPRIK